MNQRQDVMVKDLLHHLHPQSCSGSHDAKVGHAKGALVAVVGMLQAYETNLNFDEAIALAAERAPRVVIAGCCPDSWTKQFGMPPVGTPTPESWDDNTVVRTGRLLVTF
jgi:hypothetical protein